MNQTRLTLHTRFRTGAVDPRIFGGFLEHLGRAVYEGVYEPGSPHADADGLRTDVLELLRGLDMTVMRYPGGNFVSGYHWLDGVGPQAQRPVIRELAWQSIEPNQFGTDEFMGLCCKMGWSPMMSVNLGTGTPEEARSWVEYCNCPPGTKYADLRAANGHPEPHAIRLWCLGNEMDGPWQLGHVPASQYAIRAQQAAKMMRDTDPSIELVACGSCAVDLPTYMEWDREVLLHLGDHADYVSLHRYVANMEDDTPGFLAVGNSIDKQIEEMDAVCRYVQARRRSAKRTYLCFDEWNVWYKDRAGDGKGKFAPHLLEEVYNLEDALVAAAFLHSFVRHADCVKIANIAQIVNVIAPILTIGDRALVQSIYHPFALFSKRRSGESLQIRVDGPRYATAKYGTVHTVDSSAILDGRRLSVFLTNRDTSKPGDVVVEIADALAVRIESAEIVTGPDAKAANSLDQPERVRAVPFEGALIRDGRLVCQLPPLSFAAVTVELN